MPPYPLILKPTFPLDQAEIQNRSRQVKLAHPLTWGSFGLAVILPCVLANGVGAALFGIIVCLGIAGIGLSVFWGGRESAIEARVVEEMIAENNADQDRRLSAIVNQYRSRGLNHYATALGKFLLLKQGIEKRLHPGGAVSETGEQIERLVDTLCASVCREFDKVTLLDEKLGDVLISGNEEALARLQSERTEVLDAIMKAYGTLYESLESVVDLDNTTTAVPEIPTSNTQPENQLADTVESLKVEIELARRIRDRLSIPEADSEDADFHVFDQELEGSENT